jgi:hypothetical protein
MSDLRAGNFGLQGNFDQAPLPHEIAENVDEKAVFEPGESAQKTAQPSVLSPISMEQKTFGKISRPISLELPKSDLCNFVPQGGEVREDFGEKNSERGQNFVDAHGADQLTHFSAEVCEEKAYGVTSPSVILELPNSKSEQPPITGEGGGSSPLGNNFWRRPVFSKPRKGLWNIFFAQKYFGARNPWKN